MLTKQLSLGLIALFWLVCLPACHMDRDRSNAPLAVQGVMDLTHWNFGTDGPIDLSGQWEFHWSRFLPPGEKENAGAASPPDYIPVPGAWNGRSVSGQKIPGEGFATYRLNIRLARNTGPLALKVLDAATSLALFVDGRLLSSAGRPAESKEKTRPGYKPEIVVLDSRGDEIEITIHVANFYHWQGGLWLPIKLGRPGDLEVIEETRLETSHLLFASILIIGLYHICLFLFRRQDRSPLFLALFCLLMAFRALGTGERYIIHVFPGLDWEILLKSIYIDLYLAVPCFAYYLKSVFPRQISHKVITVVACVGGGLSAVVLVTPSPVYTLTMPGFQVVTILVMLYGLFAVIWAVSRREPGAVNFLIGYLALIVTGLNDILYTRQMIDSILLAPLGLLFFIFTQAIILAKRFSSAFSLAESQAEHIKMANAAYRREIEERLKVEQALMDSQKKYRLLADNVTDNIFIIGIPDFRFQYISPSVEKILGYSAEEALDLNLEAIVTVESLARAMNVLNEALSDTADGAEIKSYTLELEEIRKDGTTVWVEIIASLLLSDDGKPNGILGVSRDITDRKKAQEELVRYRERLEVLVQERTAQLTQTNEQLKQEIAERQRVEDALRKNRSLLVETQRITKTGGWEYSAERKAIYWTEEMYRILDLKMPETAGDFNLWEYELLEGIDPDYRTIFQSALEECRKSGKSFHLEFTLTTRKGSRLWVRTTAYPEIEDGEVIKIVGTLTDITQARIADEELRESETRFRTILDAVRIGIMIIDPENQKIVDVNRFAQTMFGMDKEALIGKKCYGFICPHEQGECPMADPECQVENREHAIRNNKGELIPILKTGSKIILKNKEHLLESFIDISELKKAEQELKVLGGAIEQCLTPILITDAEGNIEYVNPVFTDTTGYERGEVIGCNPRIVKSGLHSDAFYQGLWDTIKSGEIWHGEFRNRKKSGELFWEETRISPVRDDNGEIKHYIAVKMDITKRKEFESFRDDIDRIMRHDLKTPLGAIIGFPDVLMLNEKLTATEIEQLKMIQEAGYRMLAQINLSVDLFKMESGNYEYAARPVDLLKVMNRLVREYKDKIQSGRLGFQVSVRGKPLSEAEPFSLAADETLCFTMLSNILVNAIEASTEGDAISITIEETNTAVIKVRNQGTVPAPVRPRFFEKYVTHGKTKGLGLGAYSAKLMAEVQKGRIEMATSDAEGTTITIYLPLLSM